MTSNAVIIRRGSGRKNSTPKPTEPVYSKPSSITDQTQHVRPYAETSSADSSPRGKLFTMALWGFMRRWILGHPDANTECMPADQPVEERETWEIICREQDRDNKALLADCARLDAARQKLFDQATGMARRIAELTSLPQVESETQLIEEFCVIRHNIQDWCERFAPKSIDAGLTETGMRSFWQIVAPEALRCPTNENFQLRHWRVAICKAYIWRTISDRLFWDGTYHPGRAKDMWTSDYFAKSIADMELAFSNSGVGLEEIHRWRSMTVRLLSQQKLPDNDGRVESFLSEIIEICTKVFYTHGQDSTSQRMETDLRNRIVLRAVGFSRILRAQSNVFVLRFPIKPLPLAPSMDKMGKQQTKGLNGEMHGLTVSPALLRRETNNGSNNEQETVLVESEFVRLTTNTVMES